MGPHFKRKFLRKRSAHGSFSASFQPIPLKVGHWTARTHFFSRLRYQQYFSATTVPWLDTRSHHQWLKTHSGNGSFSTNFQQNPFKVGQCLGLPLYFSQFEYQWHFFATMVRKRWLPVSRYGTIVAKILLVSQPRREVWSSCPVPNFQGNRLKTRRERAMSRF